MKDCIKFLYNNFQAFFENCLPSSLRADEIKLWLTPSD